MPGDDEIPIDEQDGDNWTPRQETSGDDEIFYEERESVKRILTKCKVPDS